MGHSILYLKIRIRGVSMKFYILLGIIGLFCLTFVKELMKYAFIGLLIVLVYGGLYMYKANAAAMLVHG